MTLHELLVEGDEAGDRLDKFLAQRLGISRSAAAGLQATADGRELPNSARIRAGQLIEVELQDEQPVVLGPQELEFGIRFEDEDIAVISKPAGLAVHPGAGRPDLTLANGLLARWPGIAAVGETDRPGIVHRLDAGTSGLMVVALSPMAYERLVDSIAGREVEREYVALVLGSLSPPTGLVDAPVGRDPRNRKRMAIVEGGRPARTRYRAVEHYLAGYTLAEVTLETGRTHQIRVHMAAIGHPVAGDDAYGGGRASKKLGLHRPFLHAARLAFNHPVTDERIEIVEPLPPDLRCVLDGLGETGDER